MSEDSTPAIKKFYADYQKAFKTPPDNAFAALGYDSVGLVADAIKRAGSADPAKIREALAATKGYQGITGAISYRSGVRVPDKTVALIGVKGDKLTLSAEVLPSWIPAP
jgi:branched-chain amino acid transport system substrate-binding protein